VAKKFGVFVIIFAGTIICTNGIRLNFGYSWAILRISPIVAKLYVECDDGSEVQEITDPLCRCAELGAWV